jgi:hypothetical protein
MSRYFIKLGNFARRQFLGAGRDVQFEAMRGNLGAGFPSPNIEGVLRPPSNLLGRDDIAARIRAGSLSDPDLPIDLLRPESKMISFDTMDHTASQILHVVDLRHQLFIGIGHQQIGGRDGPVVLVPQHVD